MAVTNGTSVLLEVGGVTVNGTTSHDMSIITDMIDVTTKDSNGSKEYIAGEDDGTISVEGKYDPAATYGFSQLFAAQLAKASAPLTFGLQASSIQNGGFNYELNFIRPTKRSGNMDC